MGRRGRCRQLQQPAGGSGTHAAPGCLPQNCGSGAYAKHAGVSHTTKCVFSAPPKGCQAAVSISAPLQAPAPEVGDVAAGPAGSPLAPERAPAPALASAAAGPAASPAPDNYNYNISEDASSPPATPGAPALPWELLFIDDFQGDTLDQSKWNYVLGDGSTYGLHGFSNGEVVSTRIFCLLLPCESTPVFDAMNMLSLRLNGQMLSCPLLPIM